MMTLNEYQKLAIRTANVLRFETGLAVWTLGLAGESGEVADLVKKLLGHGHPIDDAARAKLRKEIGDVLWYVAKLSHHLDFSLDEIAQENIDKLRARYPEGFSTERSLNRLPEEIPPKPEPPPNRVIREDGTEICNVSPRSGGISYRQFSCTLKKGHTGDHRDEHHGNAFS